MLDDLTAGEVREAALLVSFFDLAGFARTARSREAREVFDVCAGFFERTGGIIADGGDRLVKAIGDAGLAVFEDADTGVQTLLEVRQAGGEWFRTRAGPPRSSSRRTVAPWSAVLSVRRATSASMCTAPLSTRLPWLPRRTTVLP